MDAFTASTGVAPATLDKFVAATSPLIAMPHDTAAFQPLSSPGHRYVLAKDWLFKEVRRAWIHAIVPVAPLPAATPYGALEPSVKVLFQIPPALLRQFEEMARAAAPNETAAWFVWDSRTKEIFLMEVPHEASRVLCKVDRPLLPAHQHLVVDVHSHHVMAPIFSEVDDHEDSASGDVKFAGVVGHIDKEISWSFRLCIEGVLYEHYAQVLRIGELP